jgi:galactonate dehydratase
MPSRPPITEISSHCVNVSPKTNWYFLRVRTSDGREAWGEASLNGWEPLLEAATRLRARELTGLDPDDAKARLRVFSNSAGGLAANAVVSALHQALETLEAEALGVPLHQALAPQVRDRVPLYANINRATSTRTPAGFAETARKAMQAGMKAFKAAPFDGVTPANCGTAEGLSRTRHGIDCLMAIRDAVGPDARVMVDCHWRFDEARALDVLAALKPVNLYWFECPVGEVYANWPAMRRVRAKANESGILTAGAETQSGLAAFETVFKEGQFDVVMPDVKYCGGPREMLRIADMAAKYGVLFSPHNPTGPICSVASTHVAAVAPECPMLEIQFDESAMFDRILMNDTTLSRNGEMHVPSGPGLGVALDAKLLEGGPWQPVPFGNETLANG